MFGWYVSFWGIEKYFRKTRCLEVHGKFRHVGIVCKRFFPTNSQEDESCSNIFDVENFGSPNQHFFNPVGGNEFRHSFNIVRVLSSKGVLFTISMVFFF